MQITLRFVKVVPTPTVEMVGVIKKLLYPVKCFQRWCFLNVFLDDGKYKSRKRKEMRVLQELVRPHEQRNPSQIGCCGFVGV